MDQNMNSFRTIKPCESHVIRNLEYSSTGDKILVIPGSSQAKVLDRDGHQLLECVKGKGHLLKVSTQFFNFYTTSLSQKSSYSSTGDKILVTYSWKLSNSSS